MTQTPPYQVTDPATGEVTETFPFATDAEVAEALAAALGDWLGDERHRHRLRAAARQRRSTLRGWEQTTQEIANALTTQ